MSELLLGGLLTAIGYVFFIWLLSLLVRRVAIIDAFWGPGFVLIVWTSWFANRPDDWEWNSRETILTSLVTVWGVRLGLHLGFRVAREQHEDRRYAAMRDRWKPHWWLKSLAVVFLLQGFIMWLVSLPVITALHPENNSRHVLLLVSGMAAWATGLFFETVGDWQLARFRANPYNHKKVLNSGLWSMTRHPNYFGDFAVWWGLWLVSFSCGAPPWTIISPLLMTVFLIRVSGVALLEKDIADRRPDYAEYVRTTNAFFPGRKRTGGS